MKKQTAPANGGKKRDKSSPKDTPPGKESLHFPIAGIGASAGGLEALEQFLQHVPEHSGIAFVIVQNLDPNHKRLMPERLPRTTDIDVFQVRDSMKVKPDCVYIIPPTRTCPFCTACCTCSNRRRPVACVSPSISSSAPSPRTGRSTASASSSPACPRHNKSWETLRGEGAWRPGENPHSAAGQDQPGLLSVQE